MPNYGDAALNLPPSWNRNLYENQEVVMLTVGHTDGVADAYKSDDPDAAHQFYWCDFRDRTDSTLARMRGYEFVNKETWEKNPLLWEWDAEGYCLYAGLRLTARPKEMFLKDQARRDALTQEARRDSDNEKVPEGLVALDAEGKVARRGRPRKAGI